MTDLSAWLPRGVGAIEAEGEGGEAELEAGIESTPNAIEPHDARTPVAYLYLAELRRRAADAK